MREILNTQFAVVCMLLLNSTAFAISEAMETMRVMQKIQARTQEEMNNVFWGAIDRHNDMLMAAQQNSMLVCAIFQSALGDDVGPTAYQGVWAGKIEELRRKAGIDIYGGHWARLSEIFWNEGSRLSKSPNVNNQRMALWFFIESLFNRGAAPAQIIDFVSQYVMKLDKSGTKWHRTGKFGQLADLLVPRR